MGAPRLVLASASPRRRQLLLEAGLAFEVDPGDVDESVPPGVAPEDVAVLLAERKARATLRRHAGADAVILAADTIVAVDRASGPEFLGKPADAREAEHMLRMLSGSRHRVVTGVCALAAARGAAVTGWERTWVTMRTLAPAEIDAYVESGEWRDRAGGYAIQETADRFVTRLEEGGFDNVVGLPVRLALDLVARARVLAAGAGSR